MVECMQRIWCVGERRRHRQWQVWLQMLEIKHIVGQCRSEIMLLLVGSYVAKASD